MKTATDLWVRHPAPPHADHPTCRDSTGRDRAIHTQANILAPNFDPEKFFADLRDTAQDTPLILSSGTIEDDDPERARIATWSAAGWDALAARTKDLSDAPRPLWLRPAAGTVLSDAQRCRKFLSDLPPSSPIRLVLDPAALLEPGMLSAAEDHLARIVDTLLDEPRVAALMLTGPPDNLADPAPFTAGDLPLDPICHAVAQWRTLDKGPLILVSRHLDQQTTALGL